MDERTNEIAKGLNHDNFYLRPIDGRVVPDHVRMSVERVNAGDSTQILDVDELVDVRILHTSIAEDERSEHLAVFVIEDFVKVSRGIASVSRRIHHKPTVERLPVLEGYHEGGWNPVRVRIIVLLPTITIRYRCIWGMASYLHSV